MFQGTRLFYLIALVVYVGALKILGYFICTTLFLAVMINVLYRQIKGEWGSAGTIVIRNAMIVVFVTVMNFFFCRSSSCTAANGNPF